MNKKAKITVFEIVLLMVSIFAFGWVLGDGFVTVSAEIKQLVDGKPTEVSLQNDGTWVNTKTGVVYYENRDGRLALERETPKRPVTATQIPASTPTGISPRAAPAAGTGAAGSGAAAGTGGIANALGGLSALASPLGQLGSLLTGTLGQALIWGGVVFGGAMAVTSVLGYSQSLVQAVSIAAGVGVFTAKIVQGYFGTSFFTSLLIGAGVGVAIFMFIYEDTKYETVTFSCMPWQAPVGVSKDTCEICNEEGRPCSEYRCKSLGQTCEIVNKGEIDEMCVNVNPKDVSPPIIVPDRDELTIGYDYVGVRSPPGPSFDIVRIGGDNKCIEAFTPLRFGISVNEPAQCKIDFKSTTSFGAMYSFMGDSNSFKYNHYEQFVLPHAEDFGNTSYQLRNGQDLTFYIRCQDKNGNTNEAEYAVNFCVDPSPDTTAPQVMLTSLEDNACIPATTDNAIVEFYTNEPAQCRWSRVDQTYDLMEHAMVCADKIFQMNALQLYTCSANLTGVTKDLTDFYVRCQDLQSKPVNDRNTNQESYGFSLRGSNQLKLHNMKPNGTIEGGINPMPVDLEVETLFGCEKGKANCYFSSNGEVGDYVLFANTNTEDGLHSQTLYLSGGEYNYSIKCVDSGGNLLVNPLTFKLNIDTSLPIIARIYNDDNQLKIVTLRESECSYSYENCDFLFDEGVPMPKDNSEMHFAEWNSDKTYFIKCRDKYRDLTADCSAIVKPTKLFY